MGETLIAVTNAPRPRGWLRGCADSNSAFQTAAPTRPKPTTREPIVRAYGPRAYDDHPPFRYPDYKSTVKRSPEKDLVRIVQTLSETTGPGPAWAELSEEDADLTTNASTGDRRAHHRHRASDR